MGEPFTRITFTVKSRWQASLVHIQAAALFARKSHALEFGYSGPFDGRVYMEDVSYSVGAVLLSASFLEATINEFFTNINDNPYSDIVKTLDSSVKTLLASMWNRGIPRTAGYPIVEKYQVALTLSGLSVIDLGSSPGQDIDILVQLRNILTHFEPEWVEHNPSQPYSKEYGKIGRKLRYKIAVNPMIGSNPYFPDQCLGHGLAEWAVQSSIAFTNLFYNRFAVPIPYDHPIYDLSTRQEVS